MNLQLDLGPSSGALGMTWLDLETTGTDELDDDIIEIGAIYTNFNFEPIGKPFSIVVDPDAVALGRLMKNDIVREMHTKNGLLEDILAHRGRTIEEAESDLCNWLTGCINKDRGRGAVDKFRFVLAGSGVSHFDKRMIKTHMPIFDKLLTHATCDVGVVRRFLKYNGIVLASAPDPDAKNHRALDDIRLHLEEAQAFRSAFREAFIHS